MAKWDSNFIIVAKPYSTVHIYLDPTRLNQALIWPVHRGPILNDILPKLMNSCYMTICDAHSRYHILKCNKISSYLTTFACPFGRYTLTRLQFGVALGGDLFQWKINESFRDLPNAFGIADDILIVGYDTHSRNHERTLKQVMQISHQFYHGYRFKTYWWVRDPLWLVECIILLLQSYIRPKVET